MTGTAHIIQGNALQLPLPDESVDLTVTSPPYFGLRSYQDGGRHYDGQIGDEATPAEFIDALIAATREMIRVTKPTGSIWVNLGDKYYAGRTGGHAGGKSNLGTRAHGGETVKVMNSFIHPTWQPKTLMGIPWRYALRAIDDLGLILRAEIIWSKPNGLPESVTDRVRRSHETWFHFTKQPRYYTAIDHIREAHTGNAHASGNGPSRQWIAANGLATNHRAVATDPKDYNPLGKLPGSVWEIPTQPLTVPEHLGVDHYAAFPIEWPRRIIAGWSPPGICTQCGQGRRPTTEGGGYDPAALARRGTASQEYSERTATGKPSPLLSVNLSGPEKDRYRIPHTITGHTCDCPTPTAPTTPSVILDPFGGTGTTALAAKALGRAGITLDMSADYNRIATWRCSDPGQLATALQVDKPPTQHDGQLDLLDGILG